MGVYPISPSCQLANIDELYEQLFGHKSNGAFVEVGGHDGFSFSMTWGLAQTGWRGLYIEPVRQLAELCEWTHEKNNVKVVQVAVGDHNSKDPVKMFVSVKNMLSASATLDEGMAKKVGTTDVINVPMKALSTVLTEEDFPTVFDLLVIDTEGTELEVLKGINLHAWQARVIIIETNNHHDEIHDYILKKYFYELLQDDGLNSIFVRDR